MKILLFILCLGLTTFTAQSATAGGCNASCYAQINAAKARQLAARRHHARIAHNKAIANQKARRAALLRQQAQRAKALTNARRGAHKPAQRHHARRNVQTNNNWRRATSHRRFAPIPRRRVSSRPLTAQQQQAVNNAYRNNSRNLSYHSRLNSAVYACSVTGNCRVQVRNY